MAKHVANDEDTDTPMAEVIVANGQSASHDAIVILLRYLKALADQSRLRLLGVLANGPRSVEELATLLDLKAPTVSHHLALLKELRLVAMQADGNTHNYLLDTGGLERLARLFGVFSAPSAIAGITGDLAGVTDATTADLFADMEDPWERKVLRSFFSGERLTEIPAQAKKRMTIIKWLATRFAWEREYPEAEVNAILKRYHPDVAYLRRELIGAKLMRREQGHYWRAEPPTAETLDALASRLTWGKLYSEAELNAAIATAFREITALPQGPIVSSQRHSGWHPLSRETTALRQELVSRGTLSCLQGKYWLSRPTDDVLDAK